MYTGLASLAKDQQVFGSRATELLATKQSRNVLYIRGTNDKKLQIRHKKLIWKFCLVSRLYHFLLSSWATNSVTDATMITCHVLVFPAEYKWLCFTNLPGIPQFETKNISKQHKCIGYWMSFSRLHYLFRHNWEKLPPIILPEQQHFEYALVLGLSRKM